VPAVGWVTEGARGTAATTDRTSRAIPRTKHLFTPAAVPSGPLHPSDYVPKGRAMGSCRRDRHTASRNPAGPTTGGAAVRLAAACGPARSGTNVTVKIPGQERYITDSKTAAKPSSDFTLRRCQTLRTPVFCKLLQTADIELQSIFFALDHGALGAPTREG
jgi:hypothetical protein